MIETGGRLTYIVKDGLDGRYMPDHTVSLERLDLRDFSPARLRLLANFGEFEKSSIWHRRFAKILRDAGYINAALKEFNTSLNLNSEDWITMEGIAYCYAVRKDYFKAIEWESKALAILAHGADEDRVECLRLISKWRHETGNREGAIEALREAISFSPMDVSILFDYINILNIESKYEEIMDLASKLQEDPSNSKDEDMLSRLLVSPNAQEIFGKAAETLGKTEVIMRAFEKSLTTAEHTKLTDEVSERSYSLTEFRCRHASESSQAMQLWEELLKKVQPRTSDDGFFYVEGRILNALSQLYYDEAVAAEANDQDFNIWISKLESMAKPSKAAESAEFYARQDNVFLLGLWYRLHGRLKEARACFKPRLLEAIDILTDDYPENDAFGFEHLAFTLHRAGDDENATAAISVAMAQLDKLKAAQQSGHDSTNQSNANNASEVNPMKPDNSDEILQQTKTPENKASLDPEANVEKDSDNADSTKGDAYVALEQFDSLDLEAQEKMSADDTDSFSWTCDGQCTRKVEDWQGIYVCDVCIDLCFCDKCAELVKGNKLGFRLCNPSHSFWQVYPSDAKLLNIATEKKDGKTVPRAAWLEKLREEWAV